jgi:pimeloyl-ACP methyl ester carboxylesterase
VSANGIRLHIAESGSGPLVLLLHGFPEFWWSWRHQLPALAAAGYRAVAVDLRGYGDSDKPPRGYDAWTLAGDISGLIKALGEPRAHLVGHGWGGLLAWTVATTRSRLVHSVSVLSAPHPLALRRGIRRGLLPYRRSGQAHAAGHLFAAQLPILPERRLTAADAARVETYFRSWSGPLWTSRPDFGAAVTRHREAIMVAGAAHSAYEYQRWAVRAQLRSEGRRYAESMDHRLTVPLLQVHGMVDPYLLPGTAERSASWYGEIARSRYLPGVGHFPHQEAPELTNRTLLGFLDSVR